MIELATLRMIWWILIGILLMGFAVMDGFDFGIAALLPLVAQNEMERRIVLNTIGPIWEGNQVWIILGAGAVFAAFPIVYAVAFSGAYFAVLLLLLTMGIMRPVSFKYRSKLPNLFWRRFWDSVIFIGGFVPAILFGVLVGNILVGLPFSFDQNLRLTYSGHFIDLLNPFALWCGLTSLMMFVMHGGLFLAIKTDDLIRERAIRWSRLAAIGVVLFFIGGGIWTHLCVTGYQVIGNIDPNGFSNPLNKTATQTVGAWLNNYKLYPFLKYVPILGIIGALGACFTANFYNSRFAFLCSSASLVGIIGTVGVSMFPFILPSSLNPSMSLLIWDASSSKLTLFTMLCATIIFLPIILLYTAWVYHVLRGKVGQAAVLANKQAY
ncbi:MAG: cytochrome d ubiquinol oxidase subunit II [Gammaproteobacteria bacterium RIFCSPHIGHO2_12_FULL_42_10]|nr:MAG: cytochrome d ubiquinol oxidase subunit II [Gammaproteobacteria bacterium RIFCSPHIGHO2_12_FULL_42_10]